MLYECEVVKKFRFAIVKGINNMETKLIEALPWCILGILPIEAMLKSWKSNLNKSRQQRREETKIAEGKTPL